MLGGVSISIRRQNVIAVLANPVVAIKLAVNNTEEDVAITVNPGGSLAYGRLKMLLKYVVKAVGAVEKRVVGEVYRRCGKGGNIFGLNSDTPSIAKS